MSEQKSATALPATQPVAIAAMPEDNIQMRLYFPIKRGEQVIDIITIRKPGSGEMRGLNFNDLLHNDVVTLNTLKKRVITPVIVEEIDMADLLRFGQVLSSFFGSIQQQLDIQADLKTDLEKKN